MKKENVHNKKKVLIVDDHPIVRQGLSLLLNQQEDLVACGEAENADQALEIVDRLKPDILVVDITLKGSSGLELIKDLKERNTNPLILVLSVHDESVYAERALRAGARGYIMKEELTDNVIIAIRQILKGGVYVSEKMSVELLSKITSGKDYTVNSPIEKLSDRELEVFQLYRAKSTDR